MARVARTTATSIPIEDGDGAASAATQRNKLRAGEQREIVSEKMRISDSSRLSWVLAIGEILSRVLAVTGIIQTPQDAMLYP